MAYKTSDAVIRHLKEQLEANLQKAIEEEKAKF